MSSQGHFLGVPVDGAFDVEKLWSRTIVEFEGFDYNDNIAFQEVTESFQQTFSFLQKCASHAYLYAHAVYPISLIMLYGHTNIHVKNGERKNMKAGTLSIVLIALIVGAAVTYWYVTSPSGNKGGLPGAVYAGRVKINLVQNKRINGAAYAIDTSQMRMLHGSMEYNDKVGDFASGAITGDLSAADKGYWYLVIDYGTNTTAWLDMAETRKSAYVSRIFGADGDKDGFDEEYVELYLGNLPTLQAGESYKEIELTLVNDPARTSSQDFTSLVNATGVGTASYAYYTCTGYTTGFTEGDLAKLARITLVTSDSGNTTYPDLDYFKLIHLKLGPYTWTASDFGAYDLANTRFKIEFGDQINSQGGLDLYDAKNAGTLWASYELKAYCKFPGAGTTLRVHINFYFYKPDGSVTSAFARNVDFVS